MLEYALVMLLASLGLPQEELAGELLTCRAIQDRSDRLHCYDKVAFRLEERGEEPAGLDVVEKPAGVEAVEEPAGFDVAEEPTSVEEPAGVEAVEEPASPTGESTMRTEPGAAEPAQPSGRWILKSEPSPADGSTMTWAKLPAVEDGSRGPRSVALVIRCQSGETSISIDWGEYLRNETVSVTTRLDSRPQVTSPWPRSPDDKQSSIYRPPGPKRTREAGIESFALQLLTAEKLAARLVPSKGSSVTAVFELAGVHAALKSIRQACRW